MITPDNISKHELVGLAARITASSNPQVVGMSGTVIDETKSMLVLRTGSGAKKSVPKRHSTWAFAIPDGEVPIDGNVIARRPEERLRVKNA